ncbi:MAG: LysR family transcriptional regulator [Bacteriovorax sp.]|nr:LysR family transcriptional regulator [Bacteriovorax sp.]
MRNFNHLFYFYIVAKLKSVTSAALHLKTSQPSLTTQIKTLEMSLGKNLFVKRGRVLELTPDGSKLFDICSRMFEADEELEMFLQGSENNELNINIGISNEIPREFVTNVIGHVLNKYKISTRPIIKINTGTHEYLIEQLKLGKINFIITNKSDNDLSLKILKEYSMPVVLAGTADFIKKLKMKSLKSSEGILKKVSIFLALPAEHLKLRSETNTYLIKNKLKYRSIFESDIISSIVRSTVDGMTFCLLPLPYIHKELQQNVLQLLIPKNGLWEHQIYIISRNSIDKFHFVKKLIVELDILT